MTPEELELARSILSVAGDGWDILVDGTRIDGLLSIVWAVATVASGWAAYQYVKCKSWDPEAKFISVFTLAVVAFFVWMIVLDGIKHAVIPEYCAVKDLVASIGGS